ncbi:MAG: stress response protein csbD-like protein [Ramlibacter sp.]|jgi:uncharacterized protein YjbJ (UPF0337 family)|nr:stress response protein csbD-like protein [Ramlibacter sp.]
MNKHQVKGSIRQAAGEVQEQAGKLTGNKEQELKGHAREQAGKVQKKAGDLKETLRESGKH